MFAFDLLAKRFINELEPKPSSNGEQASWGGPGGGGGGGKRPPIPAKLVVKVAGLVGGRGGGRGDGEWAPGLGVVLLAVCDCGRIELGKDDEDDDEVDDDEELDGGDDGDDDEENILNKSNIW